MGDEAGERVCFLAGQRAVVGDRVRWIPVRGEGGKLVGVEPRDNALTRMDERGREQVLAANLRGLLVTTSVAEPAFSPTLLHRYLVAADRAGLDVVLVLNKADLGSDAVRRAVEADLAPLAAAGLAVVRTSVKTGEGLCELDERLRGTGPWALVGASGVGKTSLAAALLPGADVGPIGSISDYWGTGRHTTTHSRLFTLPGGGEIADSPGIRTFLPTLRDAEDVRLHFPVVGRLECAFRDCLHRPGEQGCTAEARVPPALLASYRELLEEVEGALKSGRS